MTLIKLEPTYKKSTIEIEFFFNEETGTWIHVETGWRWGTFYADVTDEEMHSLQIHNEYCKTNGKWDDFEISALTGFEMDNTWDGCWMDFTVWNSAMTEEQREAVKQEIEAAAEEGEWFEWLEERDYWNRDCETFIVGEINIELIDKLPWEDS